MAQQRRILLVDDNRDATSVLVVLLQRMGHQVESAVNARAALEAARRMLPEIVFVDLVLPDMDGCELARQLKREPGLNGVRIFAKFLESLLGSASA